MTLGVGVTVSGVPATESQPAMCTVGGATQHRLRTETALRCSPRADFVVGLPGTRIHGGSQASVPFVGAPPTSSFCLRISMRTRESRALVSEEHVYTPGQALCL